MPKVSFAPMVILAVAVGFGIFVASPMLGWGLLAAGGLGGTVYLMTRCRHPHPALQPPLVDADGQRHPPHWYCDDCGQRWVAHFEHDSRPVVRFAGFDPAKAVDAARRADELETRRREMAVERSGLQRVAPSPTARRPVSLEEHRELRSAR